MYVFLTVVVTFSFKWEKNNTDLIAEKYIIAPLEINLIRNRVYFFLNITSCKLKHIYFLALDHANAIQCYNL